ncbi:DUF427 domain-containing protein [Rhodobacteraceae bacterium NNCM2]|nr:DUF427 domain-containing protein [Coraliihabitans acroporae]
MSRITIQPITGNAVVRAGGAVIVESWNALELREEGYDPVIYFPRADAITFCEPSDHRTTCPHKGEASYFHIATKSGLIENAGWSYENPIAGVEAIAGHIAFQHEKVAVEVL